MGSLRSGLQTLYVLLLLVIWRSQLASSIGTARAASPEAEADADADIVHVSQAQIPPNFSEEEEWYSFILASVKGHNELQEFNREQDGPIGTVVHGFAAKLTEAEAEALKSVNGVLSVTPDDELVELHTSQSLDLNTCSGDPGISPIPGERTVIELEQGWDFMRKGISKLINLLEGVPEQQFEPDEYMMLYTTIYNMCTQNPPHDYSQQLYDRYRGSFEDYINEMVLPAIRDKHDEFMLRELVRRWDNHKVMIRWLSRFFNYLDRYFIARRSLPGLRDVGLICFRDLVYQEMKHNAKEAVIVLIDKEREGEQIDRALLKNVLGIFAEIGMGGMEAYEKEFEAYMLEDTAGYYQRKALSWIEEDSCPDYMLKAEECLKQERERVEHYLHASSEQKLLETVQHELRSQYEHCSLSMNSSFLTKSILDAGPFLGMAR